jgi:hypothetical protein
MKHIFIATPMYGGTCHGAYAQSVFQIMKTLSDKGYQVTFRDMYNASIITWARDVLTAVFLKSDADYLLFLDSDQTFRVQDIEKMIEEDKDIIMAAYPKKMINWENVANVIKQGCPPDQAHRFGMVPNFSLLPDIELPEDLSKSFEVAGGGTGMMLIKKEVFEKLEPLVDKFKIDMPGIAGLEKGELISSFWKTTIKDNQYLMEDYNFCNMWRESGGKVFVAPWARSTHYGTYEFTGTMAI